MSYNARTIGGKRKKKKACSQFSHKRVNYAAYIIVLSNKLQLDITQMIMWN